MTDIEFHDVDLAYGRHIILQGVNLAVQTGEVFGLVGPNGSGKTTLLKAMLGQLKQSAGSITRRSSRLRWGYVPQREQIDTIWPVSVREILHMTVMAMQPLKKLRGKDPAIVSQVMEMTRLDALASKTIDTLSGGELQRVLLARALVIEPEILLLDEPTAAMDIVASEHFLDLIVELHSQWKMTVVLVCHDLSALADRTDRLGILRQGCLHNGPAADMLRSETLSSIYERPIMVERFNNTTVVFTENSVPHIRQRMSAGQ